MVNEQRSDETLVNQRLQRACQVAKEHLQDVQVGMKTYYDKQARSRVFTPGDKVLVLQPNTGPKLGARFEGPYKVHKMLNNTDYLVEMPDKRKRFKVCHINMLKPYHDGEPEAKPVSAVSVQEDSEEVPQEEVNPEIGVSVKLQNSDVLGQLDVKVSHLTEVQQQEITSLIREYSDIFPDVPGKTGVLKHDVDVGDAAPIKQHPYRVGKEKKVKMKTAKFIWTIECENAFENIKAMLVSQPVLNIPNWEKDYVLSVDASDNGAGAMLQQEGDDGILHPVSFFSKKFNTHEKNYSTVEKVALALVLAIKHYEVYLSTTRQLLVYTDHNPLIFIQRMKGKNQKILRWSLLLQQYNLKISHVKGKDNAVADALSRT